VDWSGQAMLRAVALRRLTAATLVCASVVLGISFLIGSGRAAAVPGGTGAHSCSLADKQFLGTVQSNMTQLGFWSDSLQSGDATPAVVIKQARAEARQVEATRPTDMSMLTVRSLVRKMFLEYAAAVKAKDAGVAAGSHVRSAYTLANSVHELLLQAQPGMTAHGCDLAPLLST
jgi:hypothetical protein